MTIKQEGIILAANAIFNAGQLRALLGNGNWQEISATKQEIIQSEAVQIATSGFSYTREAISATFGTFVLASNTLPIDLEGSFTGANSITTNRLAIMLNCRAFAGSPVNSIGSSSVELADAPTDWATGDTIVTNTGESFSITGLAGTTVDLSGTPIGSTTAIANSFGSLIQAKVVPTTIFAAGAGQSINISLTTSGL